LPFAGFFRFVAPQVIEANASMGIEDEEGFFFAF
jgi:hypothetical protein